MNFSRMDPQGNADPTEGKLTLSLSLAELCLAIDSLVDVWQLNSTPKAQPHDTTKRGKVVYIASAFIRKNRSGGERRATLQPDVLVFFLLPVCHVRSPCFSAVLERSARASPHAPSCISTSAAVCAAQKKKNHLPSNFSDGGRPEPTTFFSEGGRRLHRGGSNLSYIGFSGRHLVLFVFIFSCVQDEARKRAAREATRL